MRLLPDEPLPAYAHVPGRTPHPFSDPDGHSYGQTPVNEELDPARWQECRAYLRGVDLFNHGYYWEAHETWEGLWRAARRGTTANFLKGLIQLAVAGVKHLQGLPDGVLVHARRVTELFRGVGETRYLGCDVPALIALAEQIGRDGWPAEPPRLSL